jgi:hypothetical protein
MAVLMTTPVLNVALMHEAAGRAAALLRVLAN